MQFSMKKKSLDQLKLELPELTLNEGTQLFGGLGTYLPEVIVYPDNYEPESEDPEADDDDDQRNNPDYEDFDLDGPYGNDDLSYEENRNFYAQINGYLSQYPKLAEFIKNSNIRFFLDPTITEAGQYNRNTLTITLQNTNESTFIKECVHAIQDHLNMMGNPDARAALEFQEHLLGELWGMQTNAGSGNNFNSPIYNEMVNGGLFVWQDGEDVINMEYFLEHFEELFDVFKETFSNEDRYQGDLPKDFDWNWELIFDYFNIKYV